MSNFCQFLPGVKLSRTPNRKNKKRSKNVPKINTKGKDISVLNCSFISKATPKTKNIDNKTTNETVKNKHLNWWTISDETTINADDHNIFYIDTRIKNKLQSKISTIDELVNDLKKTLWISENSDTIQKIRASERANILRRRIVDLENATELMYYIHQTSSLLERYRKLIRKNGSTKSFVKSGQNENEEELKNIMENYLCIAQIYIDLTGVMSRPNKIKCEICNSSDFKLSIYDDNIHVCKKCGAEKEVFSDGPTYKDTKRINLSSKYTYTRKGHFIDTIKRYQGKQNTDRTKIQKAVDIIKEQIIQHNLVVKQGISNSVSKDHVYMFLSEQNLSNHYDDLNLIFHIITDALCPDISHLEIYLEDDFDKLEPVLESIKDEGRTNSLNVNYKLCKLLQRRGYPCRKSEFYILKTENKELEHDRKMKKAWGILEKERLLKKKMGQLYDKVSWEWIPTY